MNPDTWQAVDDYIATLLHADDPVLEATLRAGADAGLPEIQVSRTQGKFLNLLAQLHRAERILELGTLGGYSTIWLARALPSDGRLITLEFESTHVQVAQANLDAAGLADKVEIRQGRALDSLDRMLREKIDPFDLVFIDADKENYPNYLPRILELSKPGSVIIADNVVRNGEIVDHQSRDANVIGVRQFNERVAAEPRLEATAIQTVGSKGYDGFLIARVKALAPG